MIQTENIVGCGCRPLLLAVFCLSISCWSAVAAKRIELATPAGSLVVEQVDQGLGTEFNVYLAGRVVLHSKEGSNNAAFPEFPVPTIIKYVAKPIGPFDAVAVFQQFSWGNACNGGPIWFLGIGRDGSFARSNPIDVCGEGEPPKIVYGHDAIHLTLQQAGHAEEWAYSGRELERIR